MLIPSGRRRKKVEGKVLSDIFASESIPQDFVLADMLMMYKKKCRNNRSNYRALGLLNHSYKIFACILLTRTLPYIAPNISDMQAGFRNERGCQDNILILVSAINHLLSQAELTSTSQRLSTQSFTHTSLMR